MAPVDSQQACERLLGLARHLERRWENHGNPMRCHSHFDFAAIAFLRPVGPDVPEQDRTSKTCGTAGCAVGELPYCFPQSFRFNEENLRQNTSRDLIEFQQGEQVQEPNWCAFAADIYRAGCFFGLTQGEAGHLFIPDDQETELYGGDILDSLAGPHDVAQNIRQFCLLRYSAHYSMQNHEDHQEAVGR